MKRRFFFLQLGTLFGSSFILSKVALGAPNESEKNDALTIVYELHGEVARNSSDVYNVANIKALRKTYLDAGKLVSFHNHSTPNSNKVVMTFNSVQSRQEFITEYASNIHLYEKNSKKSG